MDQSIRQKYEKHAVIIKALAHPTRLFIVEQLSKKEYCVRELTKMIGDEISTVSNHLSVLKNAGIVIGNKQGLHVFYSLRIPCVLNFFSCIDSVLNAQETKQCVYPNHQ